MWEDAWCTTFELTCQEVWWCGPRRFLLTTCVLVSAWLGWFYCGAFVIHPLVSHALRVRLPSKYATEETRFWFAWHLTSLTHCIVVLCVATGPVYRFLGASPDVLFGSPPGAPTELAIRAAAGGHIFVCFIMYDLTVIIIHRLDGILMVVHHSVFVTFGVIVLYNCFFPYISLAMLTMELSTVFFNYFSFFRNRLGYEHWSVKLSFSSLAACHVVVRIGFMSYLVWLFASTLRSGSVDWRKSGPPPGGVATWQLGFMLACLVAALGLQFVWLLQGVWPKLLRVLNTKAN